MIHTARPDPPNFSSICSKTGQIGISSSFFPHGTERRPSVSSEPYIADCFFDMAFGGGIIVGSLFKRSGCSKGIDLRWNGLDKPPELEMEILLQSELTEMLYWYASHSDNGIG